jgi:hypothetical protein
MNRIGALLGSVILISVSAIAQRGEGPTGFSLVGLWSGMYHEDELERTDPGPPPGDYTGIPINEAARYHADSWDADLVSVMEHQCIPHNAIYSMRGPANLSVHADIDSSTGQLRAYVIDGTFGGATRIIWMDGRPHPSKFAAHTWGGFSTGTWEGDTLKVVTTHIKAGYLRRNGITFNDNATLTEFFDLHDKYLTVTTLAYDPIYLTEPLLRTESFVWNPYQPLAPPHAYGATCQPAPELPRPYGWVPHHLPGTNTVVSEFSKEYGIPFDATRGGAETMYPEYREKLKTMTIPPARIFLTKFEEEHEETKAQKGPVPEPAK